MPEPVSVGHKRYAEFARRALSLTGEDAGNVVLPDLQLQLDVNPDLQVRPELGYIAREYLWVGRLEAAAGGAGTFAFVRITNPASSGMLVIVEDHAVDSGGATPTEAQHFILKDDGTVAGVSAQSGFARDTRQDGIATGFVPSAFLESGSAAAIPAGGRIWASPPNTTRYRVPWPMVLDPGHSVSVWHFVANTAIAGNWKWRERAEERYEVRK
jgi:hypothetical protein